MTTSLGDACPSGFYPSGGPPSFAADPSLWADGASVALCGAPLDPFAVAISSSTSRTLKKYPLPDASSRSTPGLTNASLTIPSRRKRIGGNPSHSILRASTGFTRLALRAGIMAAIRATTPNRIGTSVMVTGSPGWIPKRNRWITLPRR